MATISLLLTATDKASPVMKKLGDNAKKIGAGLAAGAAVAGAAAIAFGIDSVKAYAESEQAQAKLSDAFARFPKLADTNLSSLQKLNSELAKKTRFDDDATAAAQATLAQYELTGEQLKQLTPLLQDYAAKTGKDLPSAAEDLGKAMLGQGRALKDVGIDFQDTGTVAGNFDQIMQGLSEKVGGFAAVDAETAAGKLEILRNRFGEVQEKIGAALMPALDGLVDWLNGDGMVVIEGLGDWIAEEAIPNTAEFVDWVIKWKDELGLVTGAIIAATEAQKLLNLAMAANPWGIVIAAIIAASTWIIHVMNNFEEFRVGVIDAAAVVGQGLVSIARGFNGFVEDLVNNMIAGINTVIRAINGVLSGVGMPSLGLIGRFEMDQSGLDAMARNFQKNRTSGVFGGGGGRRMTAFAEGGAVMGATIALIGEAGPEVVVPFDKVPKMLDDLGYGAPQGDRGGSAEQMPVFNVYLDSNLAALDARVDVRIEKAEREGYMTLKRGYQRR